jgi:glycosyltransferase involved in cell wall biosynthesis
LACFGEKNDVVDYAHLHEVFREVHVVGLDEVNHDPSLPDAVAGYESSAMRALIYRICAEHPVDLVQIEYTQMAGYREAAPNVPAILVEHDITFSLYRQFAERDKTPAATRNFQLWHKFESERLQAYDAVWTMSEDDRDLALSTGASPDVVAVVPNGVSIENFRPSPEPRGQHEILYVGSFRHLPNYLAFEELSARIMPVVWETLPNATLRVVAGPRHEEFWTGSKDIDPRITVHGFVSDIASFYRNCTIAVAPLPVSAGTNIKVMEALASARAMVTTPVGCAGLGLRHRYDAMVCDLPSFPRAICELLNKPVLRRSIGRHARETAEARFSWESIQERAADSYLRLLGEAESAVA